MSDSESARCDYQLAAVYESDRRRERGYVHAKRKQE